MPYPVLPPPPPPIVSNAIAVQPAEGVWGSHQEGTGDNVQLQLPLSPHSISDGFRLSQVSVPNHSATVNQSTINQTAVNQTAVNQSTRATPHIDWESCLASPERLPSEASSQSAIASPNNGVTRFFCIPPEQHSLSLPPLSLHGQSPARQSSLFPLGEPGASASRARITSLEQDVPEGTEQVEELHFTVDTFDAAHFPAPDIHTLAHRPGQPTPDIFVIPLQQGHGPLVPRLISQALPNDAIPLEVEVLGNDDASPTLGPTLGQLPALEGLDTDSLNLDSLDSNLNDRLTNPPAEIDTNEAPDLSNIAPAAESIIEQLDVDPSAIDPSGTNDLEPLRQNLPEASGVEDAVVEEAIDGLEDSDILNDIPDLEVPDGIEVPDDIEVPDGIEVPDDLDIDDAIPEDPVPGDVIPDNDLPDNDLPDAVEDIIGEPDLPSDVPNNSTPSNLEDSLEAATGEDALEVTADRQVYDRERQYFLAEGNALMTFRGALLQADTLRVNLRNQIVVAEGNAILTRGDQVVRGDRLEYNLIQDEGIIFDAKGEVFLPRTSSDFGANRPDTFETSSDVPLADRLATDQPVVTATASGGLVIGASNANRSGPSGGTLSRIRFEADEIAFTPDGWNATNVRLTNDPFSPPELEIRSRLVTFRRLDNNRSELRARRPRLVLDQWLHIPLLRERAIFDSRDRNPAPFQIGFDEDDRGGLFIQRPFTPIASDRISLTLTPQFFIQQAIENDDGEDETPPDLEDENSWLDPDLYGLLGELDAKLGSKTSLVGNMTLTSLDFGDELSEDDLRGSIRLQRQIYTGLGIHTLTGEYSYRDRLFNGTLGFQTVQKSLGLVLTSPRIPLGDSGIQLTYQAGLQRVNANVAADRFADLLPPFPRENNRDTLMRYQVAADLRRSVLLWSGTPLPATQNEGLKYTPSPVVPYISLTPSLRGVAGFYSSGDTQPILTGQLSLNGQFGHFSRPYLDYFGFNLSYRRSTEGSESPFNFDRVADREVLSGGITTQLFGPIRVGFRTSISLDNEQEFDNNFIIEYSRRTHGLVVRYNPDRRIGSIGLRISDFNWNGTPEPFGGSGVRTVNDGVLRND